VGTNLLQLFWFRAAVKFYNGMLSFNSATLEQVPHANLKLQPWAKTGWASDILHAFEILWDSNTYTHSLLQEHPNHYSDINADLISKVKDEGSAEGLMNNC